jgi:hypothetical protein
MSNQIVFKTFLGNLYFSEIQILKKFAIETGFFWTIFLRNPKHVFR